MRKSAFLLVVGAAFVLGIVAHWAWAPGEPTASESSPHEQMQSAVWTCSMHPQVRQPKPGLCPICAMELVPVKQFNGHEGGGGPGAFSTSEAAKGLMNVRTSPVERRFVTAEIRMTGKVDFDETRVRTITAWAPGRIERLYADYTGIRVNKGDHLVDLYSPELLTAQDELRRAVRAVEKLSPGTPEVLKDTAQTTLEAVRNRLLRWGLTRQQLARAEREGALADRITIYAPIGGTVTERAGKEGMYVETGTRIYTIADLSVVWVKLDAYESDLLWLHYGQPVEFTAEAYPGEVFAGRIAFIDPVVDARTRTVTIRVNAPNTDGKLKPGMFVRGVVRSKVATGGRVMDPGLAGKWISPMHPEVIKDGPGVCDVCGMPLVRAEDLGYVPAVVTEEDRPLAIPASAPLLTGKRAVVYVEVPGADRPTYEGREVVLGPRAGDDYLVVRGLREGERVVTHGNFKIDSALQILAKPSMMSPATHEDEETPARIVTDVPAAFQEQLDSFLKSYMVVQAALAQDNPDGAVEGVKAARLAFERIDGGLLDGAGAATWEKEYRGVLGQHLESIEKGKAIAEVRTAFQPWSAALINAIRTFGLSSAEPVYVVHCPMAFDFEGADWLQTDTTVRNPYFGSKMFSCGTVQEQIAGPRQDAPNGANEHAGDHAHGAPEGSEMKGAAHE